MKTLTLVLLALLVSTCQPVFAGGYKALTENQKEIEGAAPNALKDVLITSDASQTISLSGTLWYALTYNGLATCKVRRMNDTTKANWVAIPVAPGTTFARVVGKNTTFFNYSGCKGITSTTNGTGNSVLEIQ